jgi:hypothetical protein
VLARLITLVLAIALIVGLVHAGVFGRSAPVGAGTGSAMVVGIATPCVARMTAELRHWSEVVQLFDGSRLVAQQRVTIRQPGFELRAAPGRYALTATKWPSQLAPIPVVLVAGQVTRQSLTPVCF